MNRLLCFPNAVHVLLVSKSRITIRGNPMGFCCVLPSFDRGVMQWNSALYSTALTLPLSGAPTCQIWISKFPEQSNESMHAKKQMIIRFRYMDAFYYCQSIFPFIQSLIIFTDSYPLSRGTMWPAPLITRNVRLPNCLPWPAKLWCLSKTV